MNDRTVPGYTGPPRTTLLYQRDTPKYWVYGTPQGDANAPILATVYRRKQGSRKPEFLFMTLAESEPSTVQEGRFMDPE